VSATPSRPVRVALVIGQLTAGGAEGQLWMLCRGIDRRLVEPVVYCLSDRTKPYRERIEAANVPVRVITGSRMSRVRALRRWLRADRIDVVHAWLFIANAYAWAANRGSGRPLLTSARNCKRQGRVLDWLNRRAFAASDRVVANSQEVAHYIAREYGAPAERTTVIYNAIDTERFHPTDDAAGDELCVVMVGRLVPQKNPGLFVSAAAVVRQRVPNVRFVLIGDGPMRPWVEHEVAVAGLRDRCVVTGERHDVPELLRQADLFWLTSNWEGLPNVVLEAMASGLPVVVTDVGGARELVRSGEEGFLVQAGDQMALVEHSVALLSDAERRRHFARAARARAETFAPALMIGAMQDLYGQVTQRPRS
jgi:glycosyltransferase involved in cell wall biosynthesis